VLKFNLEAGIQSVRKIASRKNISLGHKNLLRVIGQGKSLLIGMSLNKIY
jgi:hypothetical protein